ncbi:MAG: hypothetical protein ABI707_04020 [Ferruginibacter sp.]
MNRQFKYYLQVSLIGLAVIILNLILFIPGFLFGEKIPYKSYLAFWVGLNACWPLISFISRSYSDINIINFEWIRKQMVQVYLLWVIAVVCYLFLLVKFGIPGYFIFLTFLNFMPGLAFNRFLYLGIHCHFKSKDIFLKKIIINCYNETEKKLENYFKEEGIHSLLLGFTEGEDNVTELSKYPILSNINNTLQVAKDLEVREIFSTICRSKAMKWKFKF